MGALKRKLKNIFGGKRKLQRNEAIIMDRPGNGLAKESYVRLKDNVLYYCVDGDKKVIQVESTIQGESKTTTVCNLAVCLGQSGKKVCLVDCDFRKPRVHRTFDIENENGISEYLVDKISKEQLIKKSKYNVDVINRGGKISNASLALTCVKFQNLMKELKEEYDFVLVDAPPVLQISDYVNISRVTDGLWYCFVSSTTIGFGDIYAVTTAGRILTVICGIYGILVTAMIPGVILTYYTEYIKHQENITVSLFLEKLEQLPDLSKDELVELSNRVKNIKQKHK